MVTTVNFPLPKLIASISSTLNNNTYNLTDSQIQTLYHYLNSLKTGITPNLTETVADNEAECGGAVRNIANIYGNNYHPYVATTVCVFGTIANLFNIAVLTRRDMIVIPINRILTALAVADILIMVEYIPYVFYYYMVLPKNLDFPYLGAVYVMFHAHITQVLHTISVCLTLTLAVWRYLALRYPEKNNIYCSDFRCALGIALSYLLPIILCLPTYFTITITTQEITENQTTYTLYHTDLHEIFKKDRTLLRINFWIYAVFIKLLPCCLLTMISSWLIRTLFKAKRRKRILQNHQNSKRKISKTDTRVHRTTKMLVAVLFLFLVTEFPQGIFALLIGIKGKDLFLECYQLYGEIMDILALINGAINFILYCSMNRMFRTMFGQLFKRRILARFTPPAAASDTHTTCL